MIRGRGFSKTGPGGGVTRLNLARRGLSTHRQTEDHDEHDAGEGGVAPSHRRRPGKREAVRDESNEGHQVVQDHRADETPADHEQERHGQPHERQPQSTGERVPRSRVREVKEPEHQAADDDGHQTGDPPSSRRHGQLNGVTQSPDKDQHLGGAGHQEEGEEPVRTDNASGLAQVRQEGAHREEATHDQRNRHGDAIAPSDRGPEPSSRCDSAESAPVDVLAVDREAFESPFSSFPPLRGFFEQLIEARR
jgi:hypothetical protein